MKKIFVITMIALLLMTNIVLHAQQITGSGTGTANDGYLPRFNNTTNIIGSSIYQNNLGYIGIGTTSPDRLFTLYSQGTGSATAQIRFGTFSNTLTDANVLLFGKSRGTIASPLQVGSGDVLGTLQTQGWKSGNGFINGASIAFTASGAPLSYTPTDISFNTPTESAMATAMTIKAGGNVGIGTTTPNQKLEVLSGTDYQLRLTYQSGTTNYSTFGNNIYGNLLINSQTGGLYFQTAGTSQLYYDKTKWVFNSGNVGIGTTNPTAKLDVGVNGDIKFANSSHLKYVQNSGDVWKSDTWINTLFEADGGSGFYRILTGNADPGLATELYRITSTGKVGIGNTNPYDKLDVIGSISSRSSQSGSALRFISGGLEQTNNWSDVNIIAFDNSVANATAYGYTGATGPGSPVLMFRQSNWGGAFSWGNTMGPGGQWSDYSEKMRLDNNGNLIVNYGNVGIGTTSPGSKLHIYSGVAENTYLQVHNGNAGRILRMGIPSGAGYALIENQAWDNSYQPIALVPNGGNVLIGQTTQVSTAYKLDVKGKVRADEIVVNTTGTYPDFVFEENYKLMPLNELEQNIKKLGHLPNVPSAKEVSENGIALGDMQAKLLQKVEELTLYVIELKKENDSMKKEIESIRR